MKKRKIKALLLLSGGLDSILAAKILKEQGISVTALSFKSCFFGSGQAEKSAKNLEIPLRIIDFSKEHLKMLKNPKHGYGKSMNPCIDCHLLMLKMAKEIMKKEKYDFVATGEVLGERPMSQNRSALELIEKESSLTGFLLRPHSAKLLEETIPEKKGLVDRKKLLDISGRSRRRQIELAKKWKIDWYPAPAGGCLLTDPGFGRRLKELFEQFPDFKENDAETLKYGRHFWEKGVKIIIGRDLKDNLKLEKLAKSGDVLLEMENYSGPLTLVRGYGKQKVIEDSIQKAKNLTQYYSTKARNKRDVRIRVDRK